MQRRAERESDSEGEGEGEGEGEPGEGEGEAEAEGEGMGESPERKVGGRETAVPKPARLVLARARRRFRLRGG